MTTFRVQPRAESAKPKRLRREGITPMALVERSHETIAIQAPEFDIKRAISHVDGLGRIDVHVEGEARPRKAIIKKIEQDAIRQQFLHVTLQEISEDDTVKVDLAVVPTGHSGDTEAGDIILNQPTDRISIRGRMSDLPESIEVDVSQLSVGENITAGQVQLPEGVELMSSADAVLFTIQVVKEVEIPTAAEIEAEAQLARDGDEESESDEAERGEVETGGA